MTATTFSLTGTLQPQALEWRTTSSPAIGVDRFGKDHWSTFAYIETRIVDYRGVLNGDHMRCSGARHPMLVDAGKRASVVGGADGSRYPTRCKGPRDASGRWGIVQVADHDDYDCIDDLCAAGLIEVTMPGVGDGGWFVDAYGREITLDGERINPMLVTGMTEAYLARWAVFSLTPWGVQVSSELRAHKAGGGNFHSFVPSTPGGPSPSPTR